MQATLESTPHFKDTGGKIQTNSRSPARCPPRREAWHCLRLELWMDLESKTLYLAIPYSLYPKSSGPKTHLASLRSSLYTCSLGQAMGSYLTLHQLCISSPRLECKPHLTQHQEKVLPSFALGILDTLKALSDCPVPHLSRSPYLSCWSLALILPWVSEFHSACATNNAPSTWSK